MMTLLFLLLGCAGPTSPFGAIGPLQNKLAVTLEKASGPLLTPVLPATHNERSIAESFKKTKNNISIEFFPRRQYLHDKSTLKIKIRDPQGMTSTSSIKVLYDGQNISAVFKKIADFQLSADKTEMLFSIKNFRLIADRENKIVVGYRNSFLSPIIYANYELPVCHYNTHKKILNTKGFKNNLQTLQAIQSIAARNSINPSLLAGLIAQESSFNPLAVSYAKAIGLTQITNLAAIHVNEKYPTWPNHPAMKTFSPLIIKALIKTGTINSDNEWRLDREKSIIGGTEYLQYIESYWELRENRELLTNIFNASEKQITEIILASYNSGPFRVKTSIKKKGKKWVQGKSLREARKYINKVKSYCYHFSELSFNKI